VGIFCRRAGVTTNCRSYAAPNRFRRSVFAAKFWGAGGRRGSSQVVIVPWSERAPSFLRVGHSARWTRRSNAHLIGFDVDVGLVQNLAANRAAFWRSR